MTGCISCSQVITRNSIGSPVHTFLCTTSKQLESWATNSTRPLTSGIFFNNTLKHTVLTSKKHATGYRRQSDATQERWGCRISVRIDCLTDPASNVGPHPCSSWCSQMFSGHLTAPSETVEEWPYRVFADLSKIGRRSLMLRHKLRDHRILSHQCAHSWLAGKREKASNHQSVYWYLLFWVISHVGLVSFILQKTIAPSFFESVTGSHLCFHHPKLVNRHHFSMLVWPVVSNIKLRLQMVECQMKERATQRLKCQQLQQVCCLPRFLTLCLDSRCFSDHFIHAKIC